MKKAGYQTEWNLGLLYKNEKDPQIEKDIAQAESACGAFEKKYKGKDFTSTAKKLLGALQEYEKLMGLMDSKPVLYYYLLKDIHTNDTAIAARESVIHQRLQKAENRTVFFELAIGAIPTSQQAQYLANKSLSHFRYFLQKSFDTAKYNLSEKEEKLIGLVSQTSRSMWIDANKKLLNAQTVPYKGKQIPVAEAVEILTDIPDKKERRTLRQDIDKTLKSISHMAEAEMNAVCNFKKVIDEERGLKNPYTATILHYQNEEKEVMALVNAVTKHFSSSRKFYKLQASLLKEKKITMADLYVKIGDIKTTFDFASGVALVKKSFTKFGEEYAAYLDTYLANGQIDVYPRKHKKSGGYCLSNAELPTFVFLNYANNSNSVETLAHEMGHAIHSELSRSNTPLYRDYTISVAEVASTFFEQFVSDELSEQLSDEEKMVLLHGRINRDIMTIMRQIACFNFEVELHQGIRQKGQLSREELAQLMKKHLKSYMGDAVELTDDNGYIYVYWSHIRSFFYVYSYAYGLLISKALYQKWKENPSFKTKIEQFLSAGGSKSPKDIFKSIGIDTNEAFFEAGLKGIEADIKKLEKLAKKYKKI